jgi:hypothetical protein
MGSNPLIRLHILRCENPLGPPPGQAPDQHIEFKQPLAPADPSDAPQGRKLLPPMNADELLPRARDWLNARVGHRPIFVHRHSSAAKNSLLPDHAARARRNPPPPAQRSRRAGRPDRSGCPHPPRSARGSPSSRPPTLRSGTPRPNPTIRHRTQPRPAKTRQQRFPGSTP